MDRSANSSTGSLNASQQLKSAPPDTTSPDTSSIAPPDSSQQSNDSQLHPSSATPSPFVSRDPSPTRSHARSTAASRAGAVGSRSRRSSQQEPSPSRNPRSTASALSTPSKSLSASTIPTLRPASQDPDGKTAGPQKAASGTEDPPSKDTPKWPVSPRLRSPPPQLNRPVFSSARRNDTDPPRLNLQRSALSPSMDGSFSSADNDHDEVITSGMRTPSLNNGLTLETVQEVSQPGSPYQIDVALDKVIEKLSLESNTTNDGNNSTGNNNNNLAVDTKDQRPTTHGPGADSGYDNGTIRASDARRTQSAGPTPAIARQSSTISTKQAKGKPAGEGSSQNMIVETETVASVPQVALAPANKVDSVNGTLKAKPSTETIKPKKEKKKTGRKGPAVNQGIGETPISTPLFHLNPSRRQSQRSIPATTEGCTPPPPPPNKPCGQQLQPRSSRSPLRPGSAGHRKSSSVVNFQMASLLTRPRLASSKADIFEAKVASAVDEADTSDSEETFVYDSNPPDAVDRPRRYHHSRTPSATSMASQVDRGAMRSIHSAMDNAGSTIPMKKGMKFVNSFVSNGGEGFSAGDDDGKGSGRSVGQGSGRGTARHHHHNNHLTHIGRWGRNGANSHTSLFDTESPFPNAARSKLAGNTSRQSSGPPSPRFINANRAASQHVTKKSSMQGRAVDTDDAAGADDERTPLMAANSVRSTRSRNNRRQPNAPRNLESQTYRQRPSYLNRVAACLVVTMMLLLVITGAIGFMFATSQPLTNIELVAIRNVLASDPELMFDLTLKAHNPNIVVVTIDQANMEVFAKSRHAGSDADWWKWPHGPAGDDNMESGIRIKDDPPDDPPDDDDAAPNMRLGAITEFDSPLSFEGSFFNQGFSCSTGELRLSLPGNNSAGGSERWHRIIQDEFDLILKGVVRYSLPLSQRIRSAPISGRATVKPNSADDPPLNYTLSIDEKDLV